MLRPADVIANLRAIIPALPECRGCGDCCGPAPWTSYELHQLSPDQQLRLLRSADAGPCPFRTPAGCEVYDQRPIVCRLMGVAPGLPCPHGVEPAETLPASRERAIMRRYLRLAATDDLLGRTPEVPGNRLAAALVRRKADRE